MYFLAIAVILFFIVVYNKYIEPNQFVREVQPMFKFLMESDYEFLLKLKHGDDVDVSEKFGKRVRNALLIIIICIFIFIKNLSFLYILLSVVIGYVVFKSDYSNLRSFYKRNLHHIDQMLPYYLKSLEILAQHYTIPIALSKSIEQAPEVFKSGLRKLVAEIEAGDMTVEPYMRFARDYPVRDSMRMMRLLYRLSLGSQDKKQEQLMMFSRTVSSLQNKAREQKYKERLESMERKTMIMLFTTGGGVMLLMMLTMMMMMNY